MRAESIGMNLCLFLHETAPPVTITKDKYATNFATTIVLDRGEICQLDGHGLYGVSAG